MKILYSSEYFLNEEFNYSNSLKYGVGGSLLSGAAHYLYNKIKYNNKLKELNEKLKLCKDEDCKQILSDEIKRIKEIIIDNTASGALSTGLVGSIIGGFEH